MPETKHIAALLFRRVGDSLLATPALRALKKAFPTARLQVIAEPHVERVFQFNPWIDEITYSRDLSATSLAAMTRQEHRPDIIVDFLSDPRSALACFLSRSPVRVGFAHALRKHFYTHVVPLQDDEHPIYSAEHKLKLAIAAGARFEDEHTDFFLTDEDHGFANRLWSDRGWTNELPTIAFFVHSRREHKRWPPESFANVISHSREHLQLRPVVLSTPGDDDSVKQLIQSGAVTQESVLSVRDLGQLGAILKRCTMLVGNDGGPKHVAIALNTPTLTIFGADKPEYWTPPNSDIHRFVTPAPGKQIADITPQSVIQKFEKSVCASAK